MLLLELLSVLVLRLDEDEDEDSVDVLDDEDELLTVLLDDELSVLVLDDDRVLLVLELLSDDALELLSSSMLTGLSNPPPDTSRRANSGRPLCKS